MSSCTDNSEEETTSSSGALTSQQQQSEVAIVLEEASTTVDTIQRRRRQQFNDIKKQLVEYNRRTTIRRQCNDNDNNNNNNNNSAKDIDFLRGISKRLEHLVNDVVVDYDVIASDKVETKSQQKQNQHEDHQQELIKDIGLCWCRVAGRMGDYSTAIQAADLVLQHVESLPVKPDALAYKGYALYRLQRYQQALSCLEQAAAATSANSKLTLNLAMKVEDCLVECCRKLQLEQQQLPLPPLLKFPRTPHLFRPQGGSKAITDDDIVLSTTTCSRGNNKRNKNNNNNSMLQVINSGVTMVTCTEKIDGANLGISLGYDGVSILVQNRSHYISTGEHAQFGPLTAWIEQHRQGLLSILTNHNILDEEEEPTGRRIRPRLRRRRWILYGEWMVARHSIEYYRLPGYFIAFDLFEITTDRFVSQRRLHELLQSTNIPVTPVITRRTFGPSKNIESELMDLVMTTQSQFRTTENDNNNNNDETAGTYVEGIVFRIEDDDWLLERSKLVRPDFIAGCADGHWSKRSIEKQVIDYEFADEYLKTCYCLAPAAAANDDDDDDNNYDAGSVEKVPYPKAAAPRQSDQHLPRAVENPRSRVDVIYNTSESGGHQGRGISTAKIRCHTGNVRNIDINQSQEQVIVSMPRNLSWLWPNEVAVSSTPKSSQQIKAFRDALNIRLVITLTEEEPLPTEWFVGNNDDEGCENYFYPIHNYGAPTIEQMDRIGNDVVRCVVSEAAVLEHCGGGKGRAGTIAACLLLRFGIDGIRACIRRDNPHADAGSSTDLSLYPRPPAMSSEEAIIEIRRIRPGSLETTTQENFVREYAQHLWRVYEAAPVSSLESIENLQQQEEIVPSGCVNTKKKPALKPRAPSYIILMGVPASGKTFFGRCLSSEQNGTNDSRSGTRKNSSREWVVASRDDLGRKQCEQLVGQTASRVARGTQGGIVVDCTNVTARERDDWLKVMHNPSPQQVALVFFDTPIEICIARVQARVNHPSIPYGRGESIVRGFSNRLERPSESECKRFGHIEVVRNQTECLKLLQSWGFGCT